MVAYSVMTNTYLCFVADNTKWLCLPISTDDSEVDFLLHCFLDSLSINILQRMSYLYTLDIHLMRLDAVSMSYPSITTNSSCFQCSIPSHSGD